MGFLSLIKIMIVDDHPLIREALKQILSEKLKINHFIEVDNGTMIITKIKSESPNIVILDISLPGIDGLTALYEIKKEYPNLPVLILSIQPEEQYACRAFQLGASGCVNKTTAPEDIVDAVKVVLGGGKYISQNASNLLINELSLEKKELPHLTLSKREYEVLVLIASGKSSGEISKILNLSIKTVSTYRSRILEKMNLQNNSQLIRYAFENDLV
ncbi:MAG: response regulator transcription factor [Spirochaetes bacterium]|nr:response regulator transcription factor [Spirochaetota bacterium]